ncbi:hypothetical protein D2E25_0399 [Bifidobacterium goeldii]|uniref:Uncharacterized protein n=1 Tax=Bifidobacterium goeldii TaxID=2306975 RepID=A0A430FMD6_9BIFI|nr:hypothetical protein [Bifidobacterium goeldii]RSX54093.1 hypothetical protein D2E25_0399 [Bifidobacterium goeldii]
MFEKAQHGYFAKPSNPHYSPWIAQVLPTDMSMLICFSQYAKMLGTCNGMKDSSGSANIGTRASKSKMKDHAERFQFGCKCNEEDA